MSCVHPLLLLVGRHCHDHSRSYLPWIRLSMHRRELANEEGGRYDRWNKQTSGSSTFLSYFQPAVAWLGLLGSLLVVFIFSTAQWWNGVTSASKVASAYTAVSHLNTAITSPTNCFESPQSCCAFGFSERPCSALLKRTVYRRACM